MPAASVSSGEPIRVAVIGYGYWGPNLVRNFSGLDGCAVTAVCDLDAEVLEAVARRYPSVRTTDDATALLRGDDIDAVAIATPVSTHHRLARQVIESGRHVLIEKPMTSTAEEARDLIAMAEAAGVVLMVDHTFLYTGAVRKIRELLDSGEVGTPFYFDSERISLGLLQQDINVIWDLAPHDLSILQYLFDESPESLQAVGYRHVGSGREEMATLNLHYPGGLHAQVRVSWLSPVKVRRTLLGGSRRMIVYDDVEPSEKIRVYDKGVALDLDGEEVTPLKPIYRAGDVHIPTLDRTEALQVEAAHFLECIRDGVRPLTGGPEGLAVVEWLEAADRSLAAGGTFVSLES
ncbi:MAG: oxidoreductase [Planctomycetaceae bacterium]|jgi:predicted dehydrogenase|nr:oxidoreductase [Planctomycetaceae bacterium]MDP7277455.1 Gfo/Idh/MocA family oxidoreductase [Planctomycetaceae bacterium]